MSVFGIILYVIVILKLQHKGSFMARLNIVDELIHKPEILIIYA